MSIYRITIPVSNIDEDNLAEVLGQFNEIEGFYEENELYYVYCNQSPDLNAIFKNLSIQIDQVSVEEIAKINWNSVWESKFDEVIIDDFCRIFADFHPERTHKFQYEIIINPKMSFGTGHHATTEQMIRGMSSLDFNGKEVLDFGTGTGILAILAEKMGAKRIDANDIEQFAWENTLENIKQNDCERIYVTHGELEQVPFRRYDIILANINRNILIEYASALRERLKSNGVCMLSGILENDRDIVLQVYEKAGFHLNKTTQKDDWICLTMV
jgi:ribosomal protein L11 methyltransferase